MKINKVIFILLLLSILYYPFSIILTGSFIQYDRRIEHRNRHYRFYELTIYNKTLYNKYFNDNYFIYHSQYSYKTSYGFFHLLPKVVSDESTFTTKLILLDDTIDYLYFIKYNNLEPINLHTDIYGCKTYKNTPIMITIYNSNKIKIFTIKLNTKLSFNNE